MAIHTWQLEPVPPFRLDLTVWTLRRRPDNLIDRWDGQTYRRILLIADRPVAVMVRQIAPPDRPRLEVCAIGAPEAQAGVTAALERLLGLGCDLDAWYRLAAADSWLGPLAARFRGAKPPRLPTLWETLVNAIACQQITLTLGLRLLNHLAQRYGQPHAADPAGASFPTPAALAEVAPEALRALGFSQAKARAITTLACALVSGQLDLEVLADLGDAAALATLQRLPGVGRWSAEYVLLRGLGRLHVFPGDDVGAQNNLRRALGLNEALDYQGVRRVVSTWQPYAGLVYFHLLLERIAAAGWLDG